MPGRSVSTFVANWTSAYFCTLRMVRALLARARVLLTFASVDARAEIEAMLDGALALVRSTGAHSYEPQIHVERARLAGLLSDAPSRQQWLRNAHRLFTEMGATGHVERVAPLLAAAPA